MAFHRVGQAEGVGGVGQLGGDELLDLGFVQVVVALVVLGDHGHDVLGGDLDGAVVKVVCNLGLQVAVDLFQLFLQLLVVLVHGGLFVALAGLEVDLGHAGLDALLDELERLLVVQLPAFALLLDLELGVAGDDLGVGGRFRIGGVEGAEVADDGLEFGLVIAHVGLDGQFRAPNLRP